MTATVLRRSCIVQSLVYGCLLGGLGLLPTIVLQLTGLFPESVRGAGEIAFAGGVPAALAGAITWFFVVLTRRHTAPTGSGLFACWFGTVIVFYVLFPIWMGTVAVWRRCSLSGGPSLDQCWETFSGMTVVVAMYSWWSLIFSAPVVLPFTLFGAWLWVRRLHPAIAGMPALPISR